MLNIYEIDNVQIFRIQIRIYYFRSECGFFGKFISYTRQQSIHDIFLCLHVPFYNVTVTYMSITVLQNISTNSYVHT